VHERINYEEELSYLRPALANHRGPVMLVSQMFAGSKWSAGP